MDTAPDNVYNPLTSNLFYFPLESLLWHVPSYQSDDIADLYWLMKRRNRPLLEQAVAEGK